MQAIIQRFGFTRPRSGAGTGTWLECDGPTLTSRSPVDGKPVVTVHTATRANYEAVLTASLTAFEHWRCVPAPRRGEIVRQVGEALRKAKADLGALLSWEVGKIRAEGEGEVQEAIDMADLAVGQSRMLYGLTMQSERPGHRMYEQWLPLGPVGVVTAFNFPCAPWSWNAMNAWIAGDTVIWKPSSKAFGTALALAEVCWEVFRRNGLPEGILGLLVGGRHEVGEALLDDRRIPLISATGSTRMGRHVAATVARRLGRTILELGGNNGIVVTAKADLQMAVPAIVFGAVGTAGQRCTSTRRIIVHETVYEPLKDALIKAYKQIPVGDPLSGGILMGPLIDRAAVEQMQDALTQLASQGGQVLYGGEVLAGGIYDTGTYVNPCICRASQGCPIVEQETFAPILYLIPYTDFEQALRIHNQVPQGLSSAIFTTDLREAEQFLSVTGSDCGIANVNIGTSGAEIGGAFGGEKETGGGREAGSDVWKAYMRRQTNTINWSRELPLAQGIKFEL